MFFSEAAVFLRRRDYFIFSLEAEGPERGESRRGGLRFASTLRPGQKLRDSGTRALRVRGPDKAGRASDTHSLVSLVLHPDYATPLTEGRRFRRKYKRWGFRGALLN